MATNYTTMTVGNYVFEFDFDTRYLRIAWAETPPVLVGLVIHLPGAERDT